MNETKQLERKVRVQLTSEELYHTIKHKGECCLVREETIGIHSNSHATSKSLSPMADVLDQTRLQPLFADIVDDTLTWILISFSIVFPATAGRIPHIRRQPR